MLSSGKWNDGRHWRRFAALFSCSFLIICFLIHKAKGESSMLALFVRYDGERNSRFSGALLRRLFPCEPATEKPSLEQGDDNKENVRENDEQE